MRGIRINRVLQNCAALRVRPRQFSKVKQTITAALRRQFSTSAHSHNACAAATNLVAGSARRRMWKAFREGNKPRAHGRENAAEHKVCVHVHSERRRNENE